MNWRHDLNQATLLEADSSLSYTEHCWNRVSDTDPSRTFILSKDKSNIYIFNKKNTQIK